MVSARSSDFASLPMGRMSHPIPYILSGITLYIASPFFATVPKLVANFFCGAPYDMAYKHFRRDHMDPYNLVLHLIVMALQLTMNFAFLHQLDADYVHFELKVSPNLSLTHTDFAAVGWVAVLFLTPSPIVAKVLSTGCIYLAHFVASLVAANDGIAIQVQPFLDSLVLLYFLKKAITPVSYLMTLAIRFLLQYAVFTFLSNEVLSLEFPPYAKYVFLLVITLLSHKPFSLPASGVFGFAILGGWIMAVVTRNKIFFLWAAGFIATALQGVSHRETKEPPTMPQLNNISFELSHVVFFPCLLMQAVGEHLRGEDSTKGGKKK